MERIWITIGRGAKAWSYILITLSVLFIFISITNVVAQNEMRVQGTVLTAEEREPIVGAQIFIDGVYISTTDYDGRFSIIVPRNATLEFNYSPCNTTSVTLTGQPELAPVYMQQRNVMVETVQVVAKAKTKKILVEPTDIEIKGNYFILPTKFTIPTNVFDTDHRFIVQPTIYNATKQIRYNLRPVVINGNNYERVLFRSLGFDKEADKLNDYVVDFEVSKDNDIYIYRDSLYFNPKDKDDDIRADCYLLLAGFDKPVRDIDTVTIAKGTQNAMRFFKYKLNPMTLGGTVISSLDDCDDPLADSCDMKFIPPPDLDLMSDSGEARITFAVNETRINTKDPGNKESLDKIDDIINAVQNNVDVTLKSITMVGYASPEGSYSTNKRLADLRTSGLLQIVTGSIRRDILKHVKLESKGVVQKWSMLIDIIAKDDPELSQKVADIIKATGDDFVKTPAALRKLPEYFTIISKKYLPMLRRVEYNIDYSVFRKLTDEEIEVKYEESLKSGKPLSRYEYYRMISIEKDRAKRENIEDLAVKNYKNFTWALNRVAVRSVMQDSVNLDLLQPLFKDPKPPVPIVYNQTLSALVEQNLTMADSLMMTIPEETRKTMEYAQAVISALTGYYEEALPVISKDGGLNPILLLLGMKRNEAAYNMMKLLMQENPANSYDPHMLYTMAQCANRLVASGDFVYLGEAMNYMGMLVGLFPEVAEIAQNDSDLMDLYNLMVNPEISSGGGAQAKKRNKIQKIWDKVTSRLTFLKGDENKIKLSKEEKQEAKERAKEEKKGQNSEDEIDNSGGAIDSEYLLDPELFEEDELLELDTSRADNLDSASSKEAKEAKKREAAEAKEAKKREAAEAKETKAAEAAASKKSKKDTATPDADESSSDVANVEEDLE